MKKTARWRPLGALIVFALPGMIPAMCAQTGSTPARVEQSSAPASADISGTWIAKTTTPMGDLEIVYRLKVVDGKITGSQGLPFGDSPIIDGQVTGDTFHFTVALERFGNIQNREVTGKIVGDTLMLTPALPGPPPGIGAPGGAAPPAGLPGPPPGTGPAPGSGGGFQLGPVVARRGTPTPSYRAKPVDYATLPKVQLPQRKEFPYNGLAKTPPMGWNSWNKFRTHVDDKTVRGIADAVASSGMRDASYIYINIDDGWQGSRDAAGTLRPNPNFPDMKALADYVHAKGLKLGIYSSPGPRTCAGFEGSYGHEEQDAKMYAAWGMDYLKYDWCSASRVWKDDDMQAVYQKMGEALQQTGRPIIYALCQYGRANVSVWGRQVGANLWRTTGDIRDRYDSMAKIGFAQSDLAKFAGPGHWNDPDMLEIGNGGMSTEEYRTHFSLWAMIAAPLIAGNDLRSMAPEIMEILLNKEVIAVDQDSLGKGGTQIAADGDVVVWAKPLSSGDYAVAFFNRGTQEAKGTAAWKDFGWSGKHAVRDLWAHADRGEVAEAFSSTIPAHGVVMIRVAK
jgi:alpha-galactosidase